jgi:hypothetical protein
MEKNTVAKPSTAQTKPADPRPGAATHGTPADPAVELSGSEPVVPHEEIERLAYAYWEARGGESGSAEEDWLRAESELKASVAAK